MIRASSMPFASGICMSIRTRSGKDAVIWPSAARGSVATVARILAPSQRRGIGFGKDFVVVDDEDRERLIVPRADEFIQPVGKLPDVDGLRQHGSDAGARSGKPHLE